MAQYNISSDSNVGRNTLGDSDKWVVDAGVTVDVAEDNAFFGIESFTNNQFKIFGSVQTTGNYISMLMLANETWISVEATGFVSSGTQAIVMEGDRSTLINNGTVHAGNIAVKLTGVKSFFQNQGGITSDNTAVWLSGLRSESENYGDISGLVGVNIRASSGSVDFYNAGTITGTQYAVVCANADDRIMNEGTINGDVYLRSGDDTFSLSGGTVNGDVYGGNGNDTYRIDDASLSIVETNIGGNDTVWIGLDYTLGVFIENLNLMGEGDLNGTGNSMSNVIIGTAGSNALMGLDGADRLVGDAGSDSLIGGQGKDRLFGGDGSDALSGESGRDFLDGGRGADILTGGTLRDRFIFADGYGLDTITDFVGRGRFHDLIDLSGFDGVNNFRDLMRNHVKRDGLDLIISNRSEDRLILEDTTRAELRPHDFLL